MEKEMLGNMFRYENGILFKKNKRGKKWSCWNDNKPEKGYIRVRTNNKLYYIHRLIYLFHNPEWDITDNCRDNSIDHINGNSLDNRIENLRVVNNSENMQNSTHMNGMLIKGVQFRIGRNKQWSARWQVNGKQKSKGFATEEEALDYRAEMVKIHFTHDPLKRPQTL